MDVLVLGVNPEINQAVQKMLEEQGVPTETSTDIEQAATTINVGRFKVICLGAGLPTETRASLKTAFKQKNPAIGIVETFPQVAIAHIIRALKEQKGDYPLAQGFNASETDETYTLSFQLKAPYPIRIDLYQVQNGQPIGNTLYENPNANGNIEYRLNKSLIIPNLNLASVVINNEPYFFFGIN